METKAAYEGDRIVGYIQYGTSAFGFADSGAISNEIHVPVIRMLYFEEQCVEAGRALLECALKKLDTESVLYAFFHYFGMSCYARHGKLFEGYAYIEKLLKEYGFGIEHENVYYSLELTDMYVHEPQIKLEWENVTAGVQQSGRFRCGEDYIGECELHYVSERIAYLRWIYISDSIQHSGFGTRCMEMLKQNLYGRGFRKLDTDTALNNTAAQHFYEKTGFLNRGISRSFYKK